MNSRSNPSGLGLLIATVVLFGGLAVVLYAMGLSEVAVVPTIGAVAAAAVAVQRTFSGPAAPARNDAPLPDPLERSASAEDAQSAEGTITSQENAA
ncbi:hypothetical protein [Streptomyces sp. RKAG293]|uniref:hypothetical protein n=1 Tax=Streptomyces sp. RKAG293 TaxID=2893403 RepID=UPI002033387B|nr:hypothetical protein [Streptomyces sp. RKAG293]MCM2424233.1 hypothetical protein [Streptomyces sp. RKAG293]